ncbi:histidine kinase [Streptomyces bacillaris]|uniref:sensor histidine kinase n=1 Tax=Streptomyces bacillaris TaxID=68179 RepID=UPI00335E3E0F
MTLIITLTALQFSQLFPHLPRFNRIPFLLSFGLQGALGYLPFLVLQEAWIGTPGFLAGCVLLRLPTVPAWLLFGTIFLGTDLILVKLGHGWGAALYVAAGGCVGLVVFGMHRLTELIREVHVSRVELAELAVVEERQRFAQDLHDLLGYGLNTITLKSRLAYRLVPEECDRARQEILDVMHVSQGALADARAVADGYLSLSLATEAPRAASLLSAMGIRSSSRLDISGLPLRIDTLFATVLREGLTNVLRHSHARNIRIEAWCENGSAWLLLWNDGVVPRAGILHAPHSGGGHGLRNLRRRVTALGGCLKNIADPDAGSFQIVVRVPLITLAKLGSEGSSTAIEAARAS